MIRRKSTAMLKTVTPIPGTPTASIYTYNGKRGKEGKIDGIPVWMKGESPTPGDYDRSPYCERAAYVVDEALGFRLVPPTILHLHDGKVVSAMKWVRGSYPTISRPPLLYIFDYIINNDDRHSGNWLIKPSGRVWAIDNALSFSPYVGDIVGYELPDKIRVKIVEVLKDTRKFRRRLKALLNKEQIDAVIKRMRKVLASQTNKEAK